MKTLSALAVVAATSPLEGFKKIAEGFNGLEIQYMTDTENAVNVLQNFDLMIIDKGLSHADYNKLHKLVDVLHPDAAVIAFVMTDEAFIQYKLAGLMAKWMDAQSDSKTNFIDNPKM